MATEVFGDFEWDSTKAVANLANVVSTEGRRDRIRIISARRATRSERRYLEG